MIGLDIHQKGWNERLRSYVNVSGGNTLDASLLLLTWYGFEAAESARMASTYRAINRELRAGPSLLYRYRKSTRRCFWNLQFLGGRISGSGRRQPRAARDAFERLLSYRNDLGLLAEEIDPETGDALGNFPQAFTHVGLISAAISLQEREEGKRQLPHREDLRDRARWQVNWGSWLLWGFVEHAVAYHHARGFAGIKTDTNEHAVHARNDVYTQSR